MARRAECYVDTSAFIAFLDRSDAYHPVFVRLFSEPPPFVTSALVIAEGYGWFLRRYDQGRAMQFLDFIAALSQLEIEGFGREQLALSKRAVKRFAHQKLTLADAHGLGIMADRKTRVCWSTDRHLSLTGVQLVI